MIIPFLNKQTADVKRKVLFKTVQYTHTHSFRHNSDKYLKRGTYLPHFTGHFMYKGKRSLYLALACLFNCLPILYCVHFFL